MRRMRCGSASACAGLPVVLHVPEQHRQRAHEGAHRQQQRPAALPGRAPEGESDHDGTGVGQRYRLLPEGGAEKQADSEVAPARIGAAAVLRQEPRDEDEREPAEGEHVHVLPDAVQGEHGQEARADRQVQPGDERRLPAGDPAGEGYRERDEREVEEEAREDHQERQVAHAGDGAEERAEVALERALVMKAG